MAHIWFAGVGMYLLLARRLALRRVAALAGGLTFMFCDALLTHFGNLNYNAVASWLPWVFWAYTANGGQRIANSEWRMANGGKGRGWLQDAVRGLGPAALAGVLLGVATLAGHIQVTLFIMLALAAYTILSLWLQRDDPELGRRVAFALVSLSTCLLLSLCLAAPVLLPSLELSQYTVRASWNYTQAGGYSVSPAQLVGWLIPGFLGRGPQYYWGAWPRAEVGYIGILPLILAGVALVLRRERRTWLWGGLAVASFVLALGINAIPHGWLTLLPGIGQLRAPARFVLITDFALAGLAAFGLDALLRPLEARAVVAFERVLAWRGVCDRRGLGHRDAAGLSGALAGAEPAAAGDRARLDHADRGDGVRRLAVGRLPVADRAARRVGRPSTLGWLAAGLIFLDVASLAAYHDIGNSDPSLSFRQDAIAGFLAQQGASVAPSASIPGPISPASGSPTRR